MSPMPTAQPISRDPLRIEICRDLEDLARHAAQCFVSEAGNAFGVHGRFDIALSACAAPMRLYGALTRDHFAFQVVWSAVNVFFADEPCVPEGDDRSTFHRVRESLLSRVPVSGGNIHRMRTDGAPDQAASRAEQALHGYFSGPPRFDLVVLGMGADGHVASLVPGSPLLAERERAVAVAGAAGDAPAHLTLTPAAIRSARAVMILVTGEAKADAVRNVLGAKSESRSLPAHAVRPMDGRLIWILDEAAASHLADPSGDEGAD